MQIPKKCQICIFEMAKNLFMGLGFYLSNLTIVQMNSELRPKTSKGDIIVHATILRGCHLWGRRMCTAARQPRSLSLAASEANYGHQCFVALDLDFSQVSANFTAFAKVCRLLYILPCLLLLLLYSLLLMRNSFPSQYTVQCSQASSNNYVF